MASEAILASTIGGIVALLGTVAFHFLKEKLSSIEQRQEEIIQRREREYEIIVAWLVNLTHSINSDADEVDVPEEVTTSLNLNDR